MRIRGIAVEPMTCPADAFNSGSGLIVLEPGQQWSGQWGLLSAEAASEPGTGRPLAPDGAAGLAWGAASVLEAFDLGGDPELEEQRRATP